MYETALADVKSREMGPRERTRAVSIAMKLGDIGDQLVGVRALSGGRDESVTGKYGPVDSEEVEGWYSWALEESLRVALPTKEGESGVSKGGTKAGSTGAPQEQLQLPQWVEGIDLVAVMERLAGYYSRKGKVE